MPAVFIRDSMDSTNPSLDRRKVNDETSYVGSMVPVPPSGLSAAATIGASLANGFKNFAGGDFAGAIGSAAQVGALGAEAIENSTALGNFLATAISETNKFFGGRGTAGLNASPPSSSVVTGNKPVLFQFFPEQITDQRANSVEHITPPGFSLPVPTLSGGSERIISMRLTFARERWGGRKSELERWDKYNFDVAKCVQAIRAYAYPIGASALGLSGGISPQPFMLTLPGTRIGITSDSIGAILTSYNVTYVAFFPDGQPRLAHVDMVMSEVLMDIRQNVTGRAFASIVSDAFLSSSLTIQQIGVNEADLSKGLYGKTGKNDVSRTNSIPPT